MQATTAKKEKNGLVDRMFEAGAQYGYKKSRRHPSTGEYVFGLKNGVEIFDLEKTSQALEEVREYVEKLASEGKGLLFVSSKFEAKNALVNAAERVNQPYVIRRWIGGTFTNFSQIRKRVERLLSLKADKEKGELSKYTKKEQLLIDREIENLEEKFGGIVDMEKLPDAVFVIDPREDDLAVKEAQMKNIPVIALANSDCNISGIEYPIPGNDAALSSITFFVNEIATAYEEGKKKPKE